METKNPAPTITRRGGLDCQVCVPESYTDEQAQSFLEKENPSGTTAGWQIRREGDRNLNGSPERVPCDTRVGFVHIVLDA